MQSDILLYLKQARDNLLARTSQVLQHDMRVDAVWLSGSYGRGETDEWSDLDLHVAVAEEYLTSFLDAHQMLFAQCGEPLLIFGGMLSNSMPGGTFWLVQYAPSMLEIDWNIGPTQAAVRPITSTLLFDRAGVPVATSPEPISENQRCEVANKELSFFWAMAPIAIKFAGRGHTRLAVKQVDLLEGAFIKLWYALYQPLRLQKDTYHQNRPLEPALDVRLPRFGPIIDPLACLGIIRAFCQEVMLLHPDLALLGATIHDKVVDEVARLADLAEVAARAGGSRPQVGSRR